MKVTLKTLITDWESMSKRLNCRSVDSSPSPPVHFPPRSCTRWGSSRTPQTWEWLSPVGFPNKSPFGLKDPRAGGRRGERAGSGKALSAEPKCTEVSKFLPPSPLQGSLRRGPRARNEAVHKNTAHLGGRGGIEPLTAAPSETEMCSAPIWCGKGSLPPWDLSPVITYCQAWKKICPRFNQKPDSSRVTKENYPI